MPGFMMLMHDDTEATASASDWTHYIEALAKTGKLRGGSAIGSGIARRKSGAAAAITAHIGGFIRIEAASLDDAQTLLAGNPVYEKGGTVEIRELPITG